MSRIQRRALGAGEVMPDRPPPRSIGLCTGTDVCPRAPVACLIHQTPDDTPVSLALDFLSPASFPVRGSSGHPQSRLSLTHS